MSFRQLPVGSHEQEEVTPQTKTNLYTYIPSWSSGFFVNSPTCFSTFSDWSINNASNLIYLQTSFTQYKAECGVLPELLEPKQLRLQRVAPRTTQTNAAKRSQRCGHGARCRVSSPCLKPLFLSSDYGPDGPFSNSCGVPNADKSSIHATYIFPVTKSSLKSRFV